MGTRERWRGVEGVYPQEPSGALDALKAKLFKPKAELLHEPWMVEVLPAISHTAHVSPVLAR